MAKAFAAAIPEKKISPAEVQGFLIDHKKSPTAAVKNVEGWVENILRQSNRG